MNTVLASQFSLDIAEAVHASALEALAEARQRVAVRTGRLRDSIRVETQGETIRLSASTPYAASVELRRPFLRPAMERASDLLVARLKGLP